MLHWIQSQSTLVITCLSFFFCYVMAAAAFVCAAIFSRRPIGEELKTISPVTLTPLAVILGLIIAFIAARVWENVARANEYVGQEASALSDVVLFSKGLSPEVRTNLLAAVKEHVAFVHEQDWPAMASFSANLQSEPVGLITALTVLLSFRPMERNHELAQQRAVRAIERAFEAREHRIRLSKAQIAPIQWAIIIVLSMLILVTTALIHIGRPAAMAVTVFIFSTAVAVCLLLLLVYDRPFASGGITMTPAAFREIVLH
jgi:Protein of unknown function (DUF4239)